MGHAGVKTCCCIICPAGGDTEVIILNADLDSVSIFMNQNMINLINIQWLWDPIWTKPPDTDRILIPAGNKGLKNEWKRRFGI